VNIVINGAAMTFTTFILVVAVVAAVVIDVTDAVADVVVIVVVTAKLDRRTVLTLHRRRGDPRGGAHDGGGAHSPSHDRVSSSSLSRHELHLKRGKGIRGGTETGGEARVIGTCRSRLLLLLSLL
jgi:hypothetical protein